ncbi:MAG: hypothetical protein QM778_24445 [Myxococcales bacterium]
MSANLARESLGPRRRAPKESLVVTSSAPEAQAALERAGWSLLYHRANVTEQLEAALRHDPGLVLAHVLRGFQLRLLARRDLAPQLTQHLAHARESLADRGGTARERLLFAALQAWHAGAVNSAIDALRAASSAHPSCLLSMKLQHALCFMYGRLDETRASLSAALAAHEAGSAGHGAVLGCLAFALEEAGELEAARRAAECALETAPCDAWAFHALLHVHGARGERGRALALLARGFEPFEGGGNFLQHLAWHHGLLALEDGHVDAALAIYDRQVARGLGTDYRDLINCVSLLLRLERAAVDVGTRYESLASWSAAQLGDHSLAFADVHHLLALLASGRAPQAREFLASLRAQLAQRTDADAELASRLAIPLMESLLSRWEQRELGSAQIRRASAHALRGLGGSHLQRELFALMLSDAGGASASAVPIERRSV